MSRKLPRLLFVASMVAGAGVAPLSGAYGQDKRYIDIKDNQFISKVTDAFKGDDIEWFVVDGEHTVTPEDPAKWDGSEGSPTLKKGEKFHFRFDRPGRYAYYCQIHGRDAMSGEVNVKDPNAPAPPPPPPTTSTTTTTTVAAPPPTTRPVVTTTTAPPASSAGSKAAPAAPAPTTTTAKDKAKPRDKDRKPKEEETTTSTAPPPPAPIDLPNEAIVPSLPGFGPTGTTVQSGIEDPGSAPEGEAVALLKSGKNRGGDAKKLLIVTGVGLGALGLGTAGYKYATRSSKYFPA